MSATSLWDVAGHVLGAAVPAGSHLSTPSSTSRTSAARKLFQIRFEVTLGRKGLSLAIQIGFFTVMFLCALSAGTCSLMP